MKTQMINTLFAFVLLANIYFLAGSRLRGIIKILALQGMAVGVLFALLSFAHQGSWFFWPFTFLVIISKGIIFPLLLLQTLDDTKVVSEVKPYISFTSSMMLGLLLLPLCVWMLKQLYLEHFGIFSQGVVIGTYTILIGLLVLVGRARAITQIIGYLVFENGIFLLGILLAQGIPLIIELAVLFDTLMAIVIMAMAIQRMNKELDSVDVNSLGHLKG